MLTGLAGIAVLLGVAYLISSDRRAIRLRMVGAAFVVQAVMALVVLRIPIGKQVVAWLAGGVDQLLSYANGGTSFLFGPLAKPELGGTAFAISALPVMIFFASLVSILYHFGVMQLLIRWLGAQ